MSNSVHPLSSHSARASSPADSAVLILDATGRILLADESARALWQSGADELTGENVTSLFAFEVTSSDPNWLESQWEVVLSASLGQPVTLTAQPNEGAPVAVELRTEKITPGSVGAYFAFIHKAATTSAPAGPAPAASAHGELLSLLAEKSSVGFFDLNFQQGRFYYSPVWKKQLGYADQEFANTHAAWRDIIHPEDSGAAPDQIGKKLITGPRSFSVEFRLRHKEGHYVWVQCHGLQLFDSQGALERVAGLQIDIQERKELEDASYQSEDRLESLSGHGPLGCFDLDLTNGSAWFSPAWKQLLGYRESEFADTVEAFLASLPQEDAGKGLDAYFFEKSSGQSASVGIVRLRHKAGHYVTVLSGTVRQLSRRKELQRVIGFHVALPANLSSNDAAPGPDLAAAFAELHEGVLITDASGQVLLVNPKATQLLGLSLDQTVGQPVSEVFRLVHRLSNEPGENPADKVLSTGEALPLNNEFSLMSSVGEPVPVVWSARPLAGPSGKVTGAVLVFRNPDEMSLSPEELVKSSRFESLGVLAGGIAHDFNNLLTTILGGISLARDNKDFSGLEDSDKACAAAKGLTKQLLTFAKGGTGLRQVVQPGDILRDSVRIAAAGATASIDLQVPEDLATISVDRAQILQVFQNLIINAIQAMPPAPHRGQVSIRGYNVTLAEGQVPPLAPGQYVQIDVQDNAAGIPPENLQKIWDPFFTTKKTGTGLGLATVLSIVRKHGGLIGVNSVVGTGTTFTIFLPIADRPVEVEARRAPSLRFGTGRILFMDDDEKICHLTGNMLTSLEYKFDIAKNGDEAIQFYKRYLNIGRPYDVVIMDLTVIGGMGGEECFRKLRELDPDVRAVVSSGYDNEEMAKRYLDMGFCGYLTKPYRVGELGKILKTVLG